MGIVIGDYVIKAQEWLLEFAKYEKSDTKQQLIDLVPRFDFFSIEAFREIKAMTHNKKVFSKIITETAVKAKDNEKTIVPLFYGFEEVFDFMRQHSDVIGDIKNVGEAKESNYDYFVCSDEQHVYILIAIR